jgi:hypothetical protein
VRTQTQTAAAHPLTTTEYILIAFTITKLKLTIKYYRIQICIKNTMKIPWYFSHSELFSLTQPKK